MKRGYLASVEQDGVFVKGTVWHVMDSSGKEPVSVHEAFLLGKLRCRFWGLFHGYGWLGVR